MLAVAATAIVSNTGFPVTEATPLSEIRNNVNTIKTATNSKIFSFPMHYDGV